MATNKTVCTTTRTYFRENAKPLVITVTDADGKVIYKGYATAKEFSTGSFGWHFGDKVTIKVGDTLVKCQVGLTVTCIGSKDLPKELAEAA